ncbi:tyrosine-type recombinase/integrase [Vibrio misgurnus]|uniref:tyrosine-type recombinase/integrase n=1 Tax=Vibrio misgurnus TaxID=2993714 RepID=UPI0023FA269E|nr:tyrosine-type recombinase/integrase [Vibrio sp. VCS]
MIAQEALREATSVNQAQAIHQYQMVMEKALEGDTGALLDIVNLATQVDPVTTEVAPVSEANTVTTEVNPVSEANTVSKANPVSIKTMIDDYIHEKDVSGSWTKATLATKAATVRKLVSYFERCSIQDKPIDQITRKDLLEVRTALLEDGLKLSTVNGQLRNLTSVFKYAELLDLIPKSPAVKLLLKDRGDTESKALSEVEVKHLLDYFKYDYFTECKRSKKTIDAMKYIKWIPQLAAITGARLNEILQLRKGDIKQSNNGICWYINIHDKEGNTLKNKASNRAVPLVNGAYGFDLELFLSELVDTCNDDSDNIFRFSNDQRQQNSTKIAKLVKEYRDNHPEKAPESLSMHSLRHTLSTLCFNKKMPESFAKEVLGHTQSITYGLYGSAGVEVETMYEEMIKLWQP